MERALSIGQRQAQACYAAHPTGRPSRMESKIAVGNAARVYNFTPADPPRPN
jgi:hypothetical protein